MTEMNWLREYPRFITFVILVISFVYSAYFASKVRRNLVINSTPENVTTINSLEVIKDSNSNHSSASGIINDLVKKAGDRIEQGIRQTSHLIGS